MTKKSIVTHSGIVKSINGNKMVVAIAVNSGCAHCEIKNACTVSESTIKEIDCNTKGKTFTVGQSVTVKMTTKQGFNALFLAYLFPFILLIITMIITSMLTSNEAIIGLASILIVIPYYLILWVYRKKTQARFSYQVESN